ncbi:dihydropteroate synthase [Gleimia sp. 6138-11-ORH1]|uniref:dihydropteroate synthase n=1 Tax=Gleimia sp. 6138-11-ORH1 TaxID=2973937 RepID=UPI0021672E14|nr:dihydropteroate synthase [Gleimia sp. 6138-11-ORH1]MCS4484670.1 dihydropteroate synthase [Gleimia sp. 6138-11-ORH1]
MKEDTLRKGDTSREETSSTQPTRRQGDFPQRTLVMGILNVTPDSFSDGGKWNQLPAALERAHYLREQGADLIDVGGESTRPGSNRITVSEELNRVLQVVQTLAESGFKVSVDTVHAQTAKQCVMAGAAIINDISGACFDPQMATVMAESNALCVIQHWRGFPGTDSEHLLTHNVTSTLIKELNEQVQQVLTHGVNPEQIIIDPGFGFAKDVTASWQLLREIEQVKAAFDYPILLGTSRKRMLKDLSLQLANQTQPVTVGVDELTAATSVIAAQIGAWAVRVHEPAASRAAIEVVHRLRT